MSANIRSSGSLAGIVGRGERQVGDLLHGPDHPRPLGPVPVAAAPEDDQQAAGRYRPEHPESVAERVVRVRVVHKHVEGLALLDPLHPPRAPP